MNVLLNYLAVGVVTMAASAAVVLGEPAMAELALAHTASRLDVQNIAQAGTPSIALRGSVPVRPTAP